MNAVVDLVPDARRRIDPFSEQERDNGQGDVVVGGQPSRKE
jgi:hypothetical protein